MINPETGTKTPYEEVWQDVECNQGILLRNLDGTEWYGQVGDRQLALGRSNDEFWAWQACRKEGQWRLKNLTTNGNVVLLPDESRDWKAEDVVTWEGQEWSVLEVSQ